MTTVKAKIQGKDPEDTKAQQDAAFEVLDYYIKLRVMETTQQGQRVGPNVHHRMQQYARARSKPQHPGAAAYLNEGLAYHRTVLSRLLSPASVRAYEATPFYQQLQAAEAAARTGTSPTQQGHPSRRAPLSQVEQWVTEMRTSALSAGVDLSVLGIPLGHPLRLPACASVTPPKERMADPTAAQLFDGGYWAQRGTDPTPTQKCNLGQEDPSGAGMANQMMAAVGKSMSPPPVSGTSRQYLYFPPQDRPSWFSPGVLGLGSGTVAVVLAEGHVVAVEIKWLKSSDAEFTLQAVQSKYPTVQAQRFDANCFNNYGGRVPTFEVVWAMPTLKVVYDQGCGGNEGSLTFETAVMDKLRQRAQAARIAAEPKL